MDQLLVEQATLRGRLGEHERALHILVHQLQDRSAAEDYCSWAATPQEPALGQQLFHLLLATYLDPDVPGGVDSVAAVDLLNRHGNMFDAVRVLGILPEGWSLQLLRPFLTAAVRKNAHEQRTAQVALGLARSENLQLLHDRVSGQLEGVGQWTPHSDRIQTFTFFTCCYVLAFWLNCFNSFTLSQWET